MSDSDKFDPTELTGRAHEFQEKFFIRVRQEQAVTRMRDTEVATRAGITASYYSMLQNLARPMSLRVAFSIAAVFSIELTIK